MEVPSDNTVGGSSVTRMQAVGDCRCLQRLWVTVSHVTQELPPPQHCLVQISAVPLRASSSLSMDSPEDVAHINERIDRHMVAGPGSVSCQPSTVSRGLFLTSRVGAFLQKHCYVCRFKKVLSGVWDISLLHRPKQCLLAGLALGGQPPSVSTCGR